jgi:hypothetical protein
LPVLLSLNPFDPDVENDINCCGSLKVIVNDTSNSFIAVALK